MHRESESLSTGVEDAEAFALTDEDNDGVQPGAAGAEEGVEKRVAGLAGDEDEGSAPRETGEVTA